MQREPVHEADGTYKKIKNTNNHNKKRRTRLVKTNKIRGETTMSKQTQRNNIKVETKRRR